MLRLVSTIRKELLILLRDRAGLAILFLMPVAMITIMALIQDAPFRDYQEVKIPVLLVSNDTGALGVTIERELDSSKIFQVNKLTISTNEAQRKIANGEFQIGIIIPQNATENLNKRVNAFVSKTLLNAGLSDSTLKDSIAPGDALNIIIYFAPKTKKSFRSSVLSSLKQFSSKLETRMLLEYFSELLNANNGTPSEIEPLDSFVNFLETDALEREDVDFELNSVQHNVPAWTIFGMFFIVISLSESLIKERKDGSYLRILTIPGSSLAIIAGKIVAYLCVCLVQCLLMIMVGIYLLPLFGLPELVVGTNIIAMILVTICSSLAAIGYGVLVGTVFNTQQQASTFGAVSIIILAALGGIWVPVFVMPDSIRMMAELSPLYWALNAFQTVFLNEASLGDVWRAALQLLLFFSLTTLIAYVIQKTKRY